MRQKNQLKGLGIWTPERAKEVITENSSVTPQSYFRGQLSSSQFQYDTALFAYTEFLGGKTRQ